MIDFGVVLINIYIILYLLYTTSNLPKLIQVIINNLNNQLLIFIECILIIQF